MTRRDRATIAGVTGKPIRRSCSRRQRPVEHRGDIGRVVDRFDPVARRRLRCMMHGVGDELVERNHQQAVLVHRETVTRRQGGDVLGVVDQRERHRRKLGGGAYPVERAATIRTAQP